MIRKRSFFLFLFIFTSLIWSIPTQSGMGTPLRRALVLFYRQGYLCTRQGLIHM